MTMQLTGPLPVFQSCNLWIAAFEQESNDGLPEQMRELPDAKMSDIDFLRWQRFRPLKKKRQFLNSRLAVRSILQKELGALADSVSLEKNCHGQPFLMSAQVNDLPKISLSHSGTVVAVAISRGVGPVGVDVEIIEPLRTDALCRMAASSHELERRHNLGGMSEAEFIRTLWTVKESVWKSLGGSDGISISDIQIDGDHGEFIPRVMLPPCADDQFRTRLFASQDEYVIPGTVLVNQSGGGTMSLRGCVTQRIPGEPSGIRGDFVAETQRLR